MATRYYVTKTQREALDLSETHWTRVLGNPKKPEDVSTHLWPIMTDPKTGASMLVVTDAVYAQVYPKLTPEEKKIMDEGLVTEDDPRVKAILAAQPSPP
jgi:hypothetical protein